MANKKIRVITDSVADIPQNLLDQWNIAVVPCYVDYGGKSYSDDGTDLNRADFFNYMRNNKEVATTAAPSPGLAEEIVANAMVGYDHLISINVAETLSATFNNVLLACNTVDKERTTVIDSESVSMGIGWLTLIAAEVAAETGDVDAVLQVIDKVKKNHRLFAGIYNMEYLRRSGRVTAVAASLGSLLQIKPIVQVIEKGEVVAAHRVRTFNKVRTKLRDLLQEEKGQLDRLAVIHTANEAGAQEFINDNKDLIPENTIIAEVGPTLGTHIGPDALGFVSVNKAWRS
ncbi:MAG: DegV family protein [Phototrophicaceae bacterium]